jgi:hypothetical protein
MKFSYYKKEFVGGVFGALLTAVFSLSIGMHNLNKSFELTLKKDQLYSLKSDLTLLRNVERELDENLNLLLSHDYKIEYDTEEINTPEFPIGDGNDEEYEKKINEMARQYMIQMIGHRFKVTKLEVPSEAFIVDAWQLSGPIVSNIDFELIQTLNELYRKLIRINSFIYSMKTLSVGMMIDEADINSIENGIPRYDRMLNEISKNTILDLKNVVAKELIKLQKEYSQIAL